MKEPELIAAAILLPRFRTSWTTEENILNAGLDYIRHHLDTDLDDVTSTTSSPSDEDDFFASMELGKSQVWIYSTPFLTSRSCHSKSTQVFLHLQPERLVGHAGLLFTAKRSQLHCKNLESQLLLKVNSDITE
ncbi:hypothetical protein N1851_009976 [Merluccius polli]|uniref:Uncharacterized protein n=1 Tax=Merluccius polli TaxID=89951 RepID=A0AA47MZY0_MERPO|nr:hypothetical protein N1851_009976 [Merluccius polli]